MSADLVSTDLASCSRNVYQLALPFQVSPCSIMVYEVLITACKNISSPIIFQFQMYIFSNLKRFSQKYVAGRCMVCPPPPPPPCHVMPARAMNRSQRGRHTLQVQVSPCSPLSHLQRKFRTKAEAWLIPYI